MRLCIQFYAIARADDAFIAIDIHIDTIGCHHVNMFIIDEIVSRNC